MIKHIHHVCVSAGYSTYVLTPDQEIANCVDNSILVDDAANGTARCALALEYFPEVDYFINVQGDMPDVTQEMIEKVGWLLQTYNVSTLYTIMPTELQNDPNSVKMIRAGDRALWFGRGMTGYGDWHLGIYGYRRQALEKYSSYEISTEEQVEGLEQLRWLKQGWDIGCLHTDFDGIEINTPEDLEQWHKRERNENN